MNLTKGHGLQLMTVLALAEEAVEAAWDASPHEAVWTDEMDQLSQAVDGVDEVVKDEALRMLREGV